VIGIAIASAGLSAIGSGHVAVRLAVANGTDPTRVAAQVVTGIGLLGGGVILRQGLTVRGLTTASSLWMSAAIGLACAAGAYWADLLATALTLFALAPLRFVARRLSKYGDTGRLTIELQRGEDVRALLDVLGQVRTVEISEERDRRLVVAEVAHRPDPSLLTRLADFDHVRAVRSD
jgi:putative Mg2+ transporter-C (MgtC) family protein